MGPRRYLKRMSRGDLLESMAKQSNTLIDIMGNASNHSGKQLTFEGINLFFEFSMIYKFSRITCASSTVMGI